MAYEFRTQRMVEFAETDMAGILHFSNFFRYLEAAEQALLRQPGMPLSRAVPQALAGLLWPRVHAACDYRAPLRYGDLVSIGVQVVRLGHSSVAYRMEIRREGADAEVAGQGDLAMACAREEADGRLRAVSLPEEWRQALTAYMVPRPGPERILPES